VKNRPWLKFYPQDWLSDSSLSLCSLAEKGLLIDIMALAHNGQPYGYVTNGGQALTEQELGRVLAVNRQTMSRAMANLKLRHRIGVTSGGAIYVPRMVKDGKQREQASKDGEKGGNPTLKGDVKGGIKSGVEQTLNPETETEGETDTEQKQKTYKYTEEFHKFWTTYANSLNKPKTLEAFENANQNVDFLLQAIKGQVAWKESQKRKNEFVSNWPASYRWLDDHRWEDRVESPPVTKKQDGPIGVLHSVTHG